MIYPGRPDARRGGNSENDVFHDGILSLGSSARRADEDAVDTTSTQPDKAQAGVVLFFVGFTIIVAWTLLQVLPTVSYV